jgi:hypothetical protein
MSLFILLYLIYILYTHFDYYFTGNYDPEYYNHLYPPSNDILQLIGITNLALLVLSVIRFYSIKKKK